MLHLLSEEVTVTSNIKHSTVLLPKNTCRAISSNYSLHTTEQFKGEEQEVKGSLTCFNRRLSKIPLGSEKLYEETNQTVSA